MIKTLMISTFAFFLGCIASFYYADDARYYFQMAKAVKVGAEKTESENIARDTVISGQAWDSFIATLHEAGSFIQSSGKAETPQDYIEGYRYLIYLLTSSLAINFHYADPDYPAIGVAQDDTKRWAGDNPDALYLKAAIRGDAIYRVWGKRNSVKYLGLQVTGGAFGSDNMGVISNISGDSLETDEDGNFELILSKNPHPGNWLKLDDHADMLAIRQFFYDWDTEVAAELHIERIDTVMPPPQITASELTKRLMNTAMFVAGGARNIYQVYLDDIYSNPANTPSRFESKTQYQGSKDQLYSSGHWQLADDEVMIIEMKAPEALYWNIQLQGRWEESSDYQYRQASLNGHQAVIDEDGMVRFVLAHRDPSVANWLDTSARAKGVFALRLNTVKDYSDPIAKIVKLTELQSHLPDTTVRFTPKERAVAIRQRILGIERRFNPTM